MHTLQGWISSLSLTPLSIVGLMTIAGLFFGKLSGLVKLPSIIGYLVLGVVIGPSLFGIIDAEARSTLSFITDVALGFVALSIGLELRFATLKSLGGGIISVILAESLVSSLFVTLAVYAATRELPIAILFGALAPASAPAGTVAVIREYQAKGPLTQALYAIVGFDDGIAIIIYGFAAGIITSMVSGAGGFRAMVLVPTWEIALSIIVGVIVGFVYGIVLKALKTSRDSFILTFGIILITIGICRAFDVSLIFTNLVLGIFVINTIDTKTAKRIEEGLTTVLPLLFVLFFVLAGANLHLSALPSLGIVGLVYIGARTAGKIAGAWFGGYIGKVERKIRDLSGIAILSQAGVAIGLALAAKEQFADLGPWGVAAGTAAITTITATSVVFEIIGPLTAKVALRKAGEIPDLPRRGERH